MATDKARENSEEVKKNTQETAKETRTIKQTMDELAKTMVSVASTMADVARNSKETAKSSRDFRSEFDEVAKLQKSIEQDTKAVFNLTQKIKFVDNCRDMPLAYHISDVIVSSSIEPEAFGRVSVEAQAMKKPIIASNIGGSKETVIDNKTGLLFDSGNPKSLCDKLDEIIKLDSLTLDLMGREGRKNVINRFNIDKMCLNTYSEYKKLIN